MSWRSLTWKWISIILAIFAFWIYFAPVLAERLIIARFLDSADVIFVMAGSAAYVPRTRAAAVLYKKGIAPVVLPTNDGRRGSRSGTEQRNSLYFERARREQIVNGVPKDAVDILLPAVSGTIMEATLVTKVAAERSRKSILIVTSPYHTRRVLWTFDEVFRDIGRATRIDIVPSSGGHMTLPACCWWLMTSGGRDVAGEYVKSAYYHFAY
jgi:uncharacterized SAM-binding protein YcdF (DUF218 family)